MTTQSGPPTLFGLPTYGTTLQRPPNAFQGFQYFDTDLNRPVAWTGSEWFVVQVLSTTTTTT